MVCKTLAAIDVGSYELQLKIFEVSQKKGIVMVNHVRKVRELGRDTYVYGRVDFRHIDMLCETLFDFTRIMREYRVDDYIAYATSSIREAENREIIIDRIKVKTGLDVSVISNSQQRFLVYKALAVKQEVSKVANEGTAIVDVGAGSLQISLFNEGVLITTQNIKLGSLRIRELLYKLSDDRQHFNLLIDELINNDIATFKKMYLKDIVIKNIIAIGDYVDYFAYKNGKFIDYMTREQFNIRFDALLGKDAYKLSKKMDITEEEALLMMPCIKVYKHVLDETDAENIWFPRVDLCDGIAAEYVVENKIIKINHDFDRDIINAAKVISKKYKANITHINTLEGNVLMIFDAMKKIHGLSDRERTLIQICAILHDCGKFITISHPGEASYNIIMSTEIIGLSHKEREIVANVVKFNTVDYFDERVNIHHGNQKDYLLVAKLVAILRVANAMDRSHLQKFKNSKAVIKDDNTLVITTYCREDITLERGLFNSKADFFEEVYGIKPVLRQKKEV